jgi:hypothetical protein
MKLEFLPSGAADCPLVRLFSFTPEEAGHLHQLLVGLSKGAVQSISLREDRAVDSIGGCELRLQQGKTDRGVLQTGQASFDCVLTHAGWDNMAELVEPFRNTKTAGFQWLCERTKIKLLLSKDGRW